MGRKPLDTSDETQGEVYRLTIRLTKRQTQFIDEHKGSMSRSEYVRSLITDDLMSTTLGEVAEKKAMARVTVTKASDVAKQKKLKVIPEGRHLHHFLKIGVPVEYIQGVPQYWHDCSCGERKVGP